MFYALNMYENWSVQSALIASVLPAVNDTAYMSEVWAVAAGLVVKYILAPNDPMNSIFRSTLIAEGFQSLALNYNGSPPVDDC
jgi:hypothetical protein